MRVFEWSKSDCVKIGPVVNRVAQNLVELAHYFGSSFPTLAIQILGFLIIAVGIYTTLHPLNQKKQPFKIVIIFMNRNPGRSIKRMPRTDQRKCKYPASSTPRMKL